MKYQDEKTFYFISTTGTTLDGDPRIVKRTNREDVKIDRPKLVSQYFETAGAIDKFNHVRTGSVGVEDVTLTHNIKLKQFMCIIGFLESNAYCSMLYFKPGYEDPHVIFRESLATDLIENTMGRKAQRLVRHLPTAKDLSQGHDLQEYEKGIQKLCYYCGNAHDVRLNNKTHYYCKLCQVPFCNQPKRSCFLLHLQNGLPVKKYRK